MEGRNRGEISLGEAFGNRGEDGAFTTRALLKASFGRAHYVTHVLLSFRHSFSLPPDGDLAASHSHPLHCQLRHLRRASCRRFGPRGPRSLQKVLRTSRVYVLGFDSVSNGRSVDCAPFIDPR